MTKGTEIILRKIIRRLILESHHEESEADKKDDENVLGEPDLSSEDEREKSDVEIDEASALASGGITGFQGGFEYDPENPKKRK